MVPTMPGPLSDLNLPTRRQAALDWILRAQRATPDGGVSAYYDTRSGYCPTSYPEVTGYIVPTLWDLNNLTGEDRYRTAAVEMIDWVTSVQTPIGAATSMDFMTPYVFDTGMDILGWVRTAHERDDGRALDAAVRAGNWLVGSQRPDGSWTTTPSSGTTHTYHARVAWALLRLASATGDEVFERSARRNLDWTVSRCEPNGWFRIPATRETTHFLAYTARGLIESGIALGEARVTEAGRLLADAVLKRLRPDGYLAGAFDASWREAAGSCCLTGSLQFAIVWLELAREGGDERYRDGAARALAYVSRHQSLDAENLGVRGGIAGSEPLDGDYAPFCYLAWAAKFYIDAVNLFVCPTLRLSS